MTKYLISAAVAALLGAPVYADTALATDCQVVDHGGYKAFLRGCEKLSGTNGRDSAQEADSDNGEGEGGDNGGGDNGGGDNGGSEGGSDGGDNGAE
ncbi:MAG TPA: hypothetical protein VL027_01870 [Spongiibacteraceae bacterium]|nr:hypothetical protein [Spongiibacteraceae bacterium]